MESIISQARRPDITFFSNGRIDIAARITRILRLERGDVIGIGIHRGEHYLYVRFRSGERRGRYEGTCYPSKGRSRHCRTCSVRLSRAMLSLCGGGERAGFATGCPVELPSFGTCIPIIVRG